MRFKRHIYFVMGFLLTSSISFAQDKEYVEEINRFQEKLNNQYTDAEDSPLLKKDLKKFTGHDFFPTNVDFRVNAKLDFFEDSIIFGMLTSTSRIAEYKKYAIASFEIKGKSYQLTLYRSTTPSEDPEYIDHVFLPFTDETNGDSTYGGGRYIDLKTTNNDTIIIDFNKSYNPYCAYSPFYSCPKPPKENHLNIRIDAGILKPGL